MSGIVFRYLVARSLSRHAFGPAVADEVGLTLGFLRPDPDHYSPDPAPHGGFSFRRDGSSGYDRGTASAAATLSELGLTWRTPDLVRALLSGARTRGERAYAVGWASAVVSSRALEAAAPPSSRAALDGLLAARAPVRAFRYRRAAFGRREAAFVADVHREIYGVRVSPDELVESERSCAERADRAVRRVVTASRPRFADSAWPLRLFSPRRPVVRGRHVREVPPGLLEWAEGAVEGFARGEPPPLPAGPPGDSHEWLPERPAGVVSYEGKAP